jgi:hypothetical protein
MVPGAPRRNVIVGLVYAFAAAALSGLAVVTL